MARRAYSTLQWASLKASATAQVVKAVERYKSPSVITEVEGLGHILLRLDYPDGTYNIVPVVKAFDPDQPRASDGKWAAAESASSADQHKSAASYHDKKAKQLGNGSAGIEHRLAAHTHRMAAWYHAQNPAKGSAASNSANAQSKRAHEVEGKKAVAGVLKSSDFFSLGRRIAEVNMLIAKDAAITSEALAQSGKKLPAQGKVKDEIKGKDKQSSGSTGNGGVPVTKAEEQSEATTVEMAEVSKDIFVPVYKSDESRRLVTGVVLAPEVVDAQGDIYDEEVIQKAAHDFLAQYNANSQMGLLHKKFDSAIELVESWIAPADMTLGTKKVTKGSWVMTVKCVDDSVWGLVQQGKLRGFSVGGVAKVQKLTK